MLAALALVIGTAATVQAACVRSTYMPRTAPNTDVWPLGGSQYDGVSRDTCLSLAEQGGFGFASYTTNRSPSGFPPPRCNLYLQTTVAALGGTTFNPGWDLYAFGPAYGPTTHMPDTAAATDVWPLGGAQFDGVTRPWCLEYANANGFHFVSFLDRANLNTRCNLYPQTTVAGLGGTVHAPWNGSEGWDLYAIGTGLGAFTSIHDMIPGAGENAQFDGIDIATCLQQAVSGGFGVASYTNERLPAASRCNLWSTTTLANAGGVTYNTDWDVYQVASGAADLNGTASPLTGACKAGFSVPTCSAPQFATTDDLAFPGNGAQPAVARNTIAGFPAIHAAAYANDGYYGNSASWIAGSAASWIKIDLGQSTRFERVTLGRDRTGSFNDRDPGRIQVFVAAADNVYASGNDSNDGSEYTRVFDSAAGCFSGNIAGAQTLSLGFAPTTARYVKVVVDNNGACLDEVEVFGADADGDGVANAADNCRRTANADQTDTDGDGLGNACDADDDGDGVNDGGDNCPFTANPAQTDVDGDGLGDACDADADGDGVTAGDNCPFVPNVDQTDSDGDGAGDDCDADDDNDGVCDGAAAAAGCSAGPDNCPLLANPGQADLDNDAIGDACDADRDGDGFANGVDTCPDTASAVNDDSDLDGLGDACDADDDNDGILDGGDNCPRTPNASQLDTDSDGQGDACDGDLDGDGTANGSDNCPNVANADQANFDGDGSGDACDADVDGDGVANGGDACAMTPLATTVDPANGCSLDQLCPCAGPAGTTTAWRNHGKYVSCVAQATNGFVAKGLMTSAEKNAKMSEAGSSSCGQ